MLDVILKILVWLTDWLRPPVRVQIVKFYFDQVRNEPGDSLVVITPYPRRYYSELVLTNRTHNVVYVKSIVLSGYHGKLRKEAAQWEPLRLEPGEPKKETVIFPINDGEEPVTGLFEIEVIPSIGRKSVGCWNRSDE